MKIGRYTALAVLVASWILWGTPARAQFGVGFSSDARYEITGAGTKTTGNSAALFGNLTLYPLASFATGGRFGDGTAGTSTDYGFMFGGTVGYKPAKTHASFEFGGFYWTKGSSDVYQVNLRGFWTPEWGAQIAYIASTSVGGNAETYCILYDLSSRKYAPNSRKPWVVEVGLGLFDDPSSSRNTTSMTFFVQGSVEIFKHVNLTASQWYVRDRSADLNRFAVGIGYNF